MMARSDVQDSKSRFGWVFWAAIATGLGSGLIFGPLGCIVAAVAWFVGYLSGAYEAER